MIGVWMLYCGLWALWSSAAAWMIERVLLRGRAPVRGVWIGAIALSIAGPVLGYTRVGRATASSSTSAAPRVETMRASGTADLSSPGATASASDPRSTTIATLRDVAVRADRPLAIAWALSSLVMLVYLGGGLLHLRWLRRSWRPEVVNGVRVMISDDTGPALVGVFRSTIVVPEWALALEPNALSLLMRHELEHRAAGDARVLAVAQLVVAAMPWNVMLWRQLRRLRLAVELDCDARVLRAMPDVRSYGQLLLEFGRARREVRFAGAALADHAGQLEQRIRAMSRGGRVARKSVVALSLMVGVLAVVIGCQMPAPSRPADPSPPDRVESTTSVANRDSTRSVARAKEMGTQLDTARQYDRALLRTEPALPDSLLAQLRLSDAARAKEMVTLLDSMNRQLGQAGLEKANSLSREMRDLQQRLESQNSRDPIPDVRRTLSAAARQLDSIGSGLKSFAAAGGSSGACASAGNLCGHPFALSDSADALQPEPGCSASTGSTDSVTVRFVVTDSDAARGGRIAVNAVPGAGASAGARVGFGDDGMLCSTSGNGVLRLFGAGAFDGRPIVVTSSSPTAVVVVTGSGRVLAGPVTFKRESRRIELSWPPIR